MKHFKFSLQGALAHRLHQQEQAQQVLAKAMQALLERQNEKKLLEEELEELKMSRPSSGSAEIIMHSLRYLDTLRMAIVRSQEQIEAAKATAEEARQKLAERNRDVKAMEILKEKQLLEFKKSQLTRETKLLDDLSGIAKWRSEVVW